MGTKIHRMNPSDTVRHKVSLDLLRAVAILMVLGRHSFSSGLWHRLGWSGVDLFFVISGFLVSGLMFGELKNTGNLRIGRFLARRALKIYPSFYLFLLVSLLAAWFTDRSITGLQIISEVFYLQSYIDGMWMHTWSLSVEEHFYLIMAMVLAIWQRRGFPMNVSRTMLLLVMSLCLLIALRFVYCWPHRGENWFAFSATHMRADGIWIGIILAYAYHFGSLQAWLNTKRWLFALVFVIALATLYFFSAGSHAMNTWGMTVVCLGYGGLLCLCLGWESQLQRWKSSEHASATKKRALSVVSTIGKHSYSIYLWHLFADNLLVKLGIFDAMGWVYGGVGAGLCTVGVSVLLGLLMGRIVEGPILRWRNQKFA